MPESTRMVCVGTGTGRTPPENHDGWEQPVSGVGDYRGAGSPGQRRFHSLRAGARAPKAWAGPMTQVAGEAAFAPRASQATGCAVAGLAWGFVESHHERRAAKRSCGGRAMICVLVRPTGANRTARERHLGLNRSYGSWRVPTISVTDWARSWRSDSPSCSTSCPASPGL